MHASRRRVTNEVLPGTLTGPVTTPPEPLPVDADVRWSDGTTTTVTGRATAWTPDAVHVDWYDGWRLHTAWLPVAAVRRRQD